MCGNVEMKLMGNDEIMGEAMRNFTCTSANGEEFLRELQEAYEVGIKLIEWKFAFYNLLLRSLGFTVRIHLAYCFGNEYSLQFLNMVSKIL